MRSENGSALGDGKFRGKEAAGAFCWMDQEAEGIGESVASLLERVAY